MQDWRVDVTASYEDGTLTLSYVDDNNERQTKSIEVGTNPVRKTRELQNSTITQYTFPKVIITLLQNRRFGNASITVKENNEDPDTLFNGSLEDTTGNDVKAVLEQSIESDNPKPLSSDDPTALEGGKKKKRKTKKRSRKQKSKTRKAKKFSM